MSAAATAIRSEPIRIYPSAIVLGALAVIFGMAAGYGWLGQAWDRVNYVEAWNQLTSHYDPAFSRFERGYTWSSWFARFYLLLDFQQYYTLLATGALAIKFRLLWKHADSPVLAVVVYLMFLFPLHEYTQIRAAVGFAFAYFAIDVLLDGKVGLSVLLFALGMLFHTTIAAIALALVPVLVLRRASPVMTASIFMALAAAAGLIIPKVVDTLESANPLVRGYLEQKGSSTGVNPFSGESILLLLVIAASAVVLRPWRRSRDGTMFFLGLWSLIWLVALARIPVLRSAWKRHSSFRYFCSRSASMNPRAAGFRPFSSSRQVPGC
jgi:hypothetical protein